MACTPAGLFLVSRFSFIMHASTIRAVLVVASQTRGAARKPGRAGIDDRLSSVVAFGSSTPAKDA
jgi:hypothetical protein